MSIPLNTKPFNNPTEIPTDANLENALGRSYHFYLELEELTITFKREWKYSKMSGWMKKVFDDKKALFYLIPYFDSFKISLTVRENERIEFLNDQFFNEIHPQLESAKKYSEGFALQFLITDRISFLTSSQLIKKIIEKRI
jgi:hypothetical protein